MEPPFWYFVYEKNTHIPWFSWGKSHWQVVMKTRIPEFPSCGGWRKNGWGLDIDFKGPWTFDLPLHKSLKSRCLVPVYVKVHVLPIKIVFRTMLKQLFSSPWSPFRGMSTSIRSTKLSIMDGVGCGWGALAGGQRNIVYWLNMLAVFRWSFWMILFVPLQVLWFFEWSGYISEYFQFLLISVWISFFAVS